MSLPYEYFKNNNMEHIADLQKLKDNKLKSIIQAFYKELEKLDKIKNAQLKDLKKLCDETTRIIKDIEFILIDYKYAYQKDYYNADEREAINEILHEINKINFFIKDLKTLKINSAKVKKITNDILIFIRLLNLTISELNNN